MKRPGIRGMASAHFSCDELACRHCGFFHVADAALAKLERLRRMVGRPFTPYSACRCPTHNAAVGGAPLSQHRATELTGATAFDIPLLLPKARLIAMAEAAGFAGLGVSYARFLHVDDRKRRARW